jgi:hypothetical protein
LAHPVHQHLFFLGRKRRGLSQVRLSFSYGPRGHVVALHGQRNPNPLFFHLGVRRQSKRSNPARPVATAAMRVHNAGNIRLPGGGGLGPCPVAAD